MQTLDDLYYELREHPDCIRLHMIDKEYVIGDVRDAIEYVYNDIEEDELDQLAEQWYEEHKQLLKLRFTDFYEQEDGNWLLLYNKIEEWLENKMDQEN